MQGIPDQLAGQPLGSFFTRVQHAHTTQRGFAQHDVGVDTFKVSLG